MFHLGLATSAYIEREVSYTVITNFFCSLLVLKSSLPWEILSCASQSDTKKEENELRQLCILDHFQPELNFSRVNWSSARLVTSQNGKGDQHRPPTIYWVLVLASFSKATLSLSFQHLKRIYEEGLVRPENQENLENKTQDSLAFYISWVAQWLKIVQKVSFFNIARLNFCLFM